MKKIILLLVFTCLACTGVLSKTSNDSTAVKKRGGHVFTLGVGSMIGCSDCKLTGNVANLNVLTTYGIRLGERWSVGGGLGLDNYEHWKTMPLFASASLDLFGRRKNKVFTQLHYGYSVAWIDNSEKGWGFKSAHGGEMISPSLGYRMDYGALFLSFSVGYKFQQVFTYYHYNYQPFYNYVADPINNPSTKETRINMSRLVLGMTVSWK